MRPLIILAVIIVADKVMKKAATSEMDKKKAFALKLRPIAITVQQETGINANIGITQAAHESAWGRSTLAVQANNLFGFTGESWERAGRPVYKISTTEFIKGAKTTVKRPFRKYSSWEESYRDWARLMGRPRYASALLMAKKGDLKGFAHEVKAAGYATDPKYAAKLTAYGDSVSRLV